MHCMSCLACTMKWSVLLFFAIVGVCHSYDLKEYGHMEHEERDHRMDIKDGKNDNDIYKPCETKDIQCISRFFASHAYCVPKTSHRMGYGDHEPVHRERLVIPLPHFGITCVLTNTQIYGLNGNIMDFYINKKTDNLIMAIGFKVTIDSKMAYFEYHRVGKEPLVTSDATNVTYIGPVTAIIPLKHGSLSLKDASITPFFPKCIDDFMGPKIQQHKDPQVGNLYAVLAANIPTACEEAFQYEAPSVFFAYLQKYICDFGFSISS